MLIHLRWCVESWLDDTLGFRSHHMEPVSQRQWHEGLDGSKLSRDHGYNLEGFPDHSSVILWCILIIWDFMIIILNSFEMFMHILGKAEFLWQVHSWSFKKDWIVLKQAFWRESQDLRQMCQFWWLWISLKCVYIYIYRYLMQIVVSLKVLVFKSLIVVDYSNRFDIIFELC